VYREQGDLGLEFGPKKGGQLYRNSRFVHAVSKYAAAEQATQGQNIKGSYSIRQPKATHYRGL